jgi:hypothetical protein
VEEAREAGESNGGSWKTGRRSPPGESGCMPFLYPAELNAPLESGCRRVKGYGAAARAARTPSASVAGAEQAKPLHT